MIYPVEYNKGIAISTDADRLQLAAQAMCLEEMFSATVSAGALFYGETRRREVVEFFVVLLPALFLPLNKNSMDVMPGPNVTLNNTDGWQ